MLAPRLDGRHARVLSHAHTPSSLFLRNPHAMILPRPIKCWTAYVPRYSVGVEIPTHRRDLNGPPTISLFDVNLRCEISG